MESLIIGHTLLFWCLLLHPFRQIQIPQFTAIKHLSHHIHINYISYHNISYIYRYQHTIMCFSMFSLTKNLSTQRNKYQTSLSPANGAAKYGWDSRLVGDDKIQMWARLSSWNLKKKDGWLVVFHRPIWKIRSSNWKCSPNVGVKIQKPFETTHLNGVLPWLPSQN